MTFTDILKEFGVETDGKDLDAIYNKISLLWAKLNKSERIEIITNLLEN
ncbi:hypothetical protein SAMN04487895_101537 [Paenibacillus sophorae]|uniref:Uncharacterized protein n=1 Tax=Paenibacillus sophorae TaxID=1333845 RepID=A0A1H8GIP9_9BACL|nr:hypothetical protein [Paenibacillus sophorae]QWU14245.1 hypothetical protein KP014_20255 [Paenibacillus sophorae]SEN44051.1 hypothetical protein SAMN04487895_101537 [Paenibacillus sophorae]